MDSLTQFLMGSAVGQLVLGPKQKGKGFWFGGIAASIPDLDVLPTINASIVTQLTHHRGFSHSILFCLAIPIFASFLSKKFINKQISIRRWLLFWFLAFMTHIILDVMTTWGTQIFWPNPTRYAVNSLFIIDPLITIPLLIGCILSAVKKVRKPALIGCILMFIYLSFACSMQLFMQNKFKKALAQQHIKVEKILVKPTPFNTLFWSVTTQSTTNHLRFGYARLWDSTDAISFSRPYSQETHLLAPHQNHPDIPFLLSITNGFYIIAKNENNLIITDARYGPFGGWNKHNQQQFIFNYRLNTNTNQWDQYRSTNINMKNSLTDLFQHIFKK